MSETVTIVVGTTSEAVGVAVSGGESVGLAVAAVAENVGLTVQPGGDAVSLAVTETSETVTVGVAPAGELLALSVQAANETVTLTVSEPGEGGNAMGWSDYVTRWDAEPSAVATIAAGSVYAYQLDGVTRYRLVPSPYSPTGDAFYTGFAGGVLSGLVATRG